MSLDIEFKKQRLKRRYKNIQGTITTKKSLKKFSIKQ
jgi:hypothetical protein